MRPRAALRHILYTLGRVMHGALYYSITERRPAVMSCRPLGRGDGLMADTPGRWPSRSAGRQHLKRAAYLLQYLAVRAIADLLAVLPFSALSPLARLLGNTLHACQWRRKTLTCNIRTLARPINERTVYHELAHNLLLALQPTWRDETLKSHLNAPQIDLLLQDLEKGGVLLLSAHIGPWELLPILLIPLLGTNVPVVVYRQLHNEWLDTWILRRRSRAGGAFVRDRGSSRQLVRALLAGRLVCMLCDQRPSRIGRATRTEFLSRPTLFDAGAAALQRATGASVWFACITREEGARSGGLQPGQYQFNLHVEQLAGHSHQLRAEAENLTADEMRQLRPAPSRPARKVLEAEIAPRLMRDEIENGRCCALMRAYAAALNRAVLRAPTQYFFFHRRWKDQPDEFSEQSLLRTKPPPQSSVQACQRFASARDANWPPTDPMCLDHLLCPLP